MKPSLENKARIGSRVITWLRSSLLGIAGTVLLVCWLLAYAVHPSGTFVQLGLVLPAAAYGIDLLREGRSSQGDRLHRTPHGFGLRDS
jgi:hypothetical protein